MSTTVKNIGLHNDLKQARSRYEKRQKQLNEDTESYNYATSTGLKHTAQALKIRIDRNNALHKIDKELIAELEGALGILPLEQPK